MAESKTGKMKKMFADKQLDAGQLEEVAGGSYYETADGSRFLNVLLRGHPAQPDRYGEAKLGYDIAGNSSRYKEIKAAWAVCGVELRHIGENGFNHYYIDGKSVTQGNAREHAMKVMGKKLTDSDWYWEKK